MFSFTHLSFSGSRDLADSWRPFVQSRVSELVAGASFVSVGCAAGADAFVRAAVPSAVVFRARDVRGASSWAEALRARSRACVRSVLGGEGALVCFFGSPESWGTFGTARFAVSVGVPVFAFALGFPVASLPSLGSGRWVRTSCLERVAGALSGAVLWVPHQSKGGKNA